MGEKAIGRKSNREKRQSGEKALGRKGTHRKALLSSISVPFPRCHLLLYKRTPNLILALKYRYFRCKKQHYSAPFPVPLKKHISDPA